MITAGKLLYQYIICLFGGMGSIINGLYGMVKLTYYSFADLDYVNHSIINDFEGGDGTGSASRFLFLFISTTPTHTQTR